jgi:hypothetical protein
MYKRSVGWAGGVGMVVIKARHADCASGGGCRGGGGLKDQAPSGHIQGNLAAGASNCV